MTADTIGGVWTFSIDLMRGMADAGVEFALATMGAPVTRTQRKEVSELGAVRLYESSFKLEWMNDPWVEVDQGGDWLLQIAEEFQPDLIHLNGYAHGRLPWSRPVLIAAHSCVYSWFAAVRGNPPPGEWREYRERVREGLSAASVITAPTRAMLGTLADHYGTGLPVGPAIPNGRDPALFHPHEKGEFILTAGRAWDEAKNIALLDEAAPHLAWPVRIAGESRHPNGGRASFDRIEQLGMLTPAAFAGQLAAAPIYAHPARYEPFGLTPLEAALSGCALVLADIPSLREVWGDAALFVSPDDAAGWITACRELIQNPGHRRDLATRASKRGRTFTVEKMAEGYLRAYRSILISKDKANESHPLLSFSPFRLEPRKRSFPSGICH